METDDKIREALMAISKKLRKHLVRIGRIGGQSATHIGITSSAKKVAAKQNGRKGGRPREFPKCEEYGAHRFSKRADGSIRCPCGFERPGSG